MRVALCVQFNLGKSFGGVMDKMGFGNPTDLGLSEDDAKEMEARLRAGEMSFDDFLTQVKVMQKAASMQAMLGKLGGNQMTQEQLDEGKRKMQRFSSYIEYMEPEERADCKILIDEMQQVRSSGGTAACPRIDRIAEASGSTKDQVGQFIFEFNTMRGAAVKFANGESAESIQESMRAEQEAEGAAPLNRQQRRMKKKKKTKAASGGGGFGRR